MSDDLDPLMIARLFQNVPRQALLVAMATIFPLCEAQGLLHADQVRPILAALTSESEIPHELLGISREDIFHPAPPSREDQIEALYVELHEIAVSGTSGEPTTEAHFQERLARLRALQNAEADEMAAFARQRREVPVGAADALFAHVDTLLHRHENPPGSDDPGDSRG
jgi:hypothetical protein